MPSSLFLILRRMRAPLIALILIYALTIAGLVTIPGVDAEGHPVRMDFLHAFYFVSYTATTIGFGEIPHSFTPAQRLWVTFCIYLTVIGWSYAFVKLLALAQDPWLQQAIRAQHFKHQIANIAEPFYLICSYGDAGSLLCRALDDLGRRFVVIDPKPERVAEVDVAGYRSDVPALAADARQPETLVLAGLRESRCAAVLALTADDHVNLAIAAAARLLNPDIKILCRAENPAIASDMALFGVEHTIDPHQKFGEYLVTAIESPGSYQLQQWLTGMPGTSLGKQTEPPRGRWIVYGEGLFAAAVTRRLISAGMTVEELSSPAASRAAPNGQPPVAAARHPSDEPLLVLLGRSGIDRAIGFVAGTEDDVRNLSIIVAARRINPDLFFVVRQNRKATQRLFQAFNSDITVTSPEIVVHECLAHLTTPLLPWFLATVGAHDDEWADATLLKLRTKISREVPVIWTVELSAATSPACFDFLHRGVGRLRLDHLIRDPDNRDAHLRAVALMITHRDGTDQAMPDPELEIRLGDQILFAGTPACKRNQEATLLNVNVLHYVYFGRHVPSGWLARKLLATAAARPPH